MAENSKLMWKTSRLLFTISESELYQHWPKTNIFYSLQKICAELITFIKVIKIEAFNNYDKW